MSRASVKVEDKMARAKIGAGVEGGRRMRQALAAVVENVRSDCEHYVPKETGTLRSSVDTSRGEEGLISWHAVAPKTHHSYAVYVYHMPASTNWTTPGTGPQWVERAARAGGIERWSKIAAGVLNG